jgi:hypothetical protein
MPDPARSPAGTCADLRIPCHLSKRGGIRAISQRGKNVLEMLSEQHARSTQMELPRSADALARIFEKVLPCPNEHQQGMSEGAAVGKWGREAKPIAVGAVSGSRNTVTMAASEVQAGSEPLDWARGQGAGLKSFTGTLPELCGTLDELAHSYRTPRGLAAITATPGEVIDVVLVDAGMTERACWRHQEDASLVTCFATCIGVSPL